MNYTAQVIYPDFIEFFDVFIDKANLEIKLIEIREKVSDRKGILTLDLSKDIASNYDIFPYEDGDLAIIQHHNSFLVCSKTGTKTDWYTFTSEDLIKYLFNNDIVDKIIPFIDEDKYIFLNSLLNDFVRNDYSHSNLNKRIKYAKVSILLSFIKERLKCRFARIILDETVLGDVEIDDLGIAFRFAQERFVKLVKINNVSKILLLLKREKIITKEFSFIENAVFINNPNGGDKIKLVFGEGGVKFDYQILPAKNYIFDLGEGQYGMNVGNLFKEDVRGKVIVFNGDERDLMINTSKS
jgi:hypothetical protein